MGWSCLSPSTSHLAIKRLAGILLGIERLLLCGALCHLLLIDLLDVGLNPPDVAQWVAHTTTSVPPEQARHLSDGNGSSREGLLVHSIGIFDVQTQEARGIRPPLSCIKAPDDRVTNFGLGMSNRAVFVIRTGELLRSKGLFQEIEDLGRIS